ncbi:MAG TPA: carboxypeptidase-like regulatory domain-containing protein [Blastocatellia bacterium]|nr:carboxypeptidase-like regulatory domain-containing protein [Blastocatellia bacterium]
MSNKLDQIQIPVPCAADWEEMAGNDRMRYCAGCKKNVYDLSKMTRIEAEALIATKRDGLCARIARNPDGTILTEALPAIMPADGRRASPVAAALVTAIIGLSPNVAAHTSSVMHNTAPGYALGAGVKSPKQDSQGATATVAGIVTDKNGDLLQVAIVRLINTSTGQERTTAITQDGRYSFAQVEVGTYSMKANASGFATVELHDITVQLGEQTRVDLAMGIMLEPVNQGGLVAMPVYPLRRLYDKSELVVVARPGKSVRIETKGEARLMKTLLQVSSTHKGAEGVRKIDLYHLVYGDNDEIYDRGGNLLLFLKRRQGEQKGSKQGYELIDSARGVKELPEADLQTYIQRIDELAAITSKGEPDRAEIVEWLLRCAEHPATRWDGVYDLEINANVLAEDETDISTEETEEAEEPVAESDSEPAEEVVEEEDAESESDDEDPGKELFARLLTAAQKERLSQALFNVQTITESDIRLIDVVRYWDDGRLIPFLLSQLKQEEANPPRVADQIMNSIANWLEDAEVMGAYDRYTKNVSYVDEGEAIDESDDLDAGKVGWAEARRNRGDMVREFIKLVESKIKK